MTTTNQSHEPERMAEPRYETLKELTDLAVFVVEVSRFEQQTLWERYAQKSQSAIRAPIDWRDCGRGWLIKIGTVDERPVNLSIFGATLNGRHVLFYEVVSQLADYALAETWFKEHCWPLWDSGTRRAHCDAMNFHHCVEVVTKAEHANTSNFTTLWQSAPRSRTARIEREDAEWWFNQNQGRAMVARSGAKWDKSGLKEACQRGLELGRTHQEFDLQLLLDMLLEIERLESTIPLVKDDLEEIHRLVSGRIEG